MEHPAGFFGGNNTNAKHAAELHAGKVNLEGTGAEVIPASEYVGTDALLEARGVASQFVVMAASDAVPVRLEVC